MTLDATCPLPHAWIKEAGHDILNRFHHGSLHIP